MKNAFEASGSSPTRSETTLRPSTLTLTEKIHAQQIRQRLLNGYPPESAFCELKARISDAELIRQERAAHLEKLAWLAARRADRESPFNKIVRKAMSNA